MRRWVSLGTASAAAEFGVGGISLPGLKLCILFERPADAFGDDGRGRRGMGSFEEARIKFDIGSGFFWQMNGHGNFFTLGRDFNEWHKLWFTPYLMFDLASNCLGLALIVDRRCLKHDEPRLIRVWSSFDRASARSPMRLRKASIFARSPAQRMRAVA